MKLAGAAVAVVLIVLVMGGTVGSVRASLTVGGKPVLPGAWGLPYGQGSSPGGPAVFNDGDLVYDTSILVYVLNSAPQSQPLTVSLEQFDPGTATRYVNETQGNTTALVPVQVDVRENPQWSNVTATLAPSGLTVVQVPVPVAQSTRQVELRVGNAIWELEHLTPAGSSLAGLYSTWGLDGVLLIEAGVTTAVFLAFTAAARGLAKRIHRPPKVPVLWPAGWIIVPLGFFFAEYVPTNQFLGSLSPFLYPVFFAVAAFPYLPRLWKEFDWTEFNGFRSRSSTEGEIPKAILPVVRSKDGLRCAPETWREAFYTLLGVPMPAVRMDTVNSAGIQLKLEPAGFPATCPLAPWYASDVDVVFWYDARKGLSRTRHRLRLFREERQVEPAPFAEGQPPTGAARRLRRRWDPHVEAGSLTGSFPPVRDIAEYITGIRAVEQEALDHEVDRLLVAELRAQMLHRQRKASTELLDVALEALGSTGDPAKPGELDGVVRRAPRGHEMEERNGDNREPKGEA
ncbi:MAG: hypothetical protein L3J96_00415 [Thermoplasmata archaeon]|nr:hypothetical protein [Thermoplasmata archaeon]